MLSSPKPCTKPSATRFFHQLQGTLEQAATAETIPSLQLLSQKLQTLKSKLSRGMQKRQQFQDLITKCETLVKQKLRNARIKGKFLPPVSPSLKKAKSEQEFRTNGNHYSGEERMGKGNDFGDETREEYKDNREAVHCEKEYMEFNQKLGDIRREIKREKEEKGRLKSKVEELKEENKAKSEELIELKGNVDRLTQQVERIESKKNINQVIKSSESSQQQSPKYSHIPPRSPHRPVQPHLHIQVDPSQAKSSPRHQTFQHNITPYIFPNPMSTSSAIKSIHHSHNLYTLDKEHLLLQFQERINQKNTVILQLEHHIATLELENSQLRSTTAIKSTHLSEGVQSLKIMLKSSNDKLESAIKQKLELKETIKQLEVKNEVFAVEIQKLIREGNRWRQEIEKKDKIMESKLLEERRNKDIGRCRQHRHECRDGDAESDKLVLFERLEGKDKQILSLREDMLKMKHDVELVSMALRTKQDRVDELQEQLHRRNLEKEVEINVKRVELARTKSEEFNNTLKNNSMREQARRTQANVNKSMDITRKLNALEGIRNIIRRFPHGQ